MDMAMALLVVATLAFTRMGHGFVTEVGANKASTFRGVGCRPSSPTAMTPCLSSDLDAVPVRKLVSQTAVDRHAVRNHIVAEERGVRMSA